MKLSRVKKLLYVVLIVAFSVISSGNILLAVEHPQDAAAGVQPKVSYKRPANIPPEFVVTPFGYSHPSCVHTVGPQDVQLADGRVQHADGAIEGQTSCGYPHYAKDGGEVRGGASKHPSGSESDKPPVNVSSSEDAEVLSDSDANPYGGLYGFWVVPDAPKANDNQLLYFWQGLEDAASGESVLQPVMNWNQGKWSIQSWNYKSGNSFTGPSVEVSTGDVIYASITHNCAAGTVVCPTWNVLMVDLTTGKSSVLANTPGFGEAYSWAFSAFLEPYGAVSCADYPRDGSLTFWNVTLLDLNLKPIRDPHWKGYWPTPSSCPFKVKVDDPKIITLRY